MTTDHGKEAMSFNEEQKALIREIAWEVSAALEKRIAEQMDMKISLHAGTCPTRRFVWLSMGAALVLGAMAGSVAAGIRLLIGN